MKSLIALALLLSSISPLIQADAISDNAAQIAQQIESDVDIILDKEESLLTTFSNFMSNLAAILAEKTAQAKIILHNLMISIVEMSQYLTKRSMTLDSDNDHNLFKAIDEQMFGRLSDIAVAQAHTMSVIKAMPTAKTTNRELKDKHNAQVQKILNFFAGIVQNFFTIVQAPESKENVAQGLIGILGNIIGAGNTIINESQQNGGANNAIAQVVETIDKDTKQQILDLIQSQGKLVRFNKNV